jgi:hypothetical protein
LGIVAKKGLREAHLPNKNGRGTATAPATTTTGARCGAFDVRRGATLAGGPVSFSDDDGRR